MSGTYYSENLTLDQLFGTTSIVATVPSTWYIALSTTTPNEAGTGVTEPSGGAYARIGVANDKTTFSTAALGSLTNDIEITFVESSASWGTVTYVAFYDALAAGNLWYYEALPVARAVASNTTVYFAAGSLTIVNTN